MANKKQNEDVVKEEIQEQEVTKTEEPKKIQNEGKKLFSSEKSVGGTRVS
ncbi:MAG: hypothetical protein J6Y02_19065 [Pseudobutyrivibrio sp.]|nr:hypothetical protein [Pseudobutyrivibrio sp.]